MMYVKFQDGIELSYLNAFETEEYYSGSNRRTLTLTCFEDAISLDEIHSRLTENNLASFTLVNDDPEVNTSNIYDGYVLLISCGIQSVQVEKETTDHAAIYAPRLVIKLGKRTYIEQKLYELGIN